MLCNYPVLQSPDFSKPFSVAVDASDELPPPQDKQELMRFRGMIQYLAKFIPNLSEVSAPLRKLLENAMHGIGKRSKRKAMNN